MKIKIQEIGTNHLGLVQSISQDVRLCVVHLFASNMNPLTIHLWIQIPNSKNYL